jgi:TolB-like protein
MFLLAVSAQQAETHGLADQMAESLKKASAHSIVVFDFIGPDNKLNGLGQKLADEFSITLQNRAPEISVVDRATVRDLIERNRVAPDVVREKEIAWWLASQLKVDAVILGQLMPVGDQIKIAIGSIALKTGGASPGFSIMAPLSDEMKAMLAVSVAKVHAVNSSQLMSERGILPKCIHCPNPNFSSAAVKDRVGGTALLSALIGLNGQARDIEIIKPLSHRLTEQAIVALQSWTFVPGKSANGEAVEVETPIEVSFRFTK